MAPPDGPELPIRSLVQEETLIAIASASEDEPAYGLSIAEQTGHKSGTLYPALGRLVELGLITAATEAGDPKTLERPLRTYYSLTDEARERMVPYLEERAARITAALEKLREAEK